MSARLNVAIVVMRYGTEVVGGAELHARWIAEHMSRYWNITIITTKAVDHVTWRNEYKNDVDEINGIKILRFAVDRERDIAEFNITTAKIFAGACSKDDVAEWIKQQGPYSTSMLNYLEKHKNDYDAFIFYTREYATTYFGLPIVKEKAFLQPLNHDEPSIYLDAHKEIMKMPRGMILNTVEELELTRKVFNNYEIPAKMIGVGINAKKLSSEEIQSVKKKYKLNKPYVIYVGRIEPGKGSHELFEFIKRYNANKTNMLDLVLIGKAVVVIPQEKYIKFLGYLPEEEKAALIGGAEILVNPSKFESLSMIIMESWIQEVPVLVNGNCAVLKGQCLRSNGGLWYSDFEEFSNMTDWLIEHKSESKKMGINGAKYVKLNYSWNVIEKKYLEFISEVLKIKKIKST